MQAIRGFLALAVVSCMTVAAMGDGFIVVRPQPRPVPVPQGHYRFAPLEVKYHHVEVEIRGQVAVTKIDQVFHNPNNARLEGDYLFPMPEGANIRRFSMDVNGKMTDAELLDADKARQIYTDIVRSMKDPALLEYVGRGLYKCRIFPIEPKSDKRIQLEYTQLLTNDSGLIGYTYPLNTEKFSAAPIKSVSVKVDVQHDQALRSVYSPSHGVEVVRKDTRHATVGFEVENARPDTDFQLFFSVAPPDDALGVSLLTYREESGEPGYFLLMASPGIVADDSRVVKKDVVFVLDTSGSMAGKKLEQAQKALKFCVHNLNKGDRFQIVRFSTEAENVFSTFQPVNETTRGEAEKAIDGFKATGGTAIEEALVEALKPSAGREGKDAGRPYVVIFLTDGRPTVGASDEDVIIKSAKQAMGDSGARVFCFGVGTSINTHLLDKLTAATRGTSQYVMPEEDIEVKVSSFYNKINHPVMTNVDLAFGKGVRVSQLHPGNLPDVFAGDQLMVFGRYKGEGDAAITLSGQLAGESTRIIFEGAFPGKATAHTFVPRLWATRRVGYLLEQIRVNGENNELRDEVTQLARKWGIVTPYTAYLIVEDESRRQVADEDRTLAPAEPSARRELEHDGASFDAEGGASGVSAAKTTADLKNAGKASDAAEAGRSGPGGERQPAVHKYLKRDEEARQRGRGGDAEDLSGVSRSVADRTFYYNGNAWVDANIHTAGEVKRVSIKFDSDEYYDLIARHPEAAKWLSVGEKVHVLIKGTVYEIG